MIVCDSQTCPAPVPSVPPGSAQSAVTLMADDENIWAKQAAAMLDAYTNVQPAHDPPMRRNTGLLSPRNSGPDLVRYRLSCSLGTNTEDGDWTSTVKLLHSEF